MTIKKIISTPKAPAAIGPYSQAIRIGDFLYTSGQISLDPETMEMITGDIEVETEKVLKNIEAILKEDGLNLNNIIKTTAQYYKLKVSDMTSKRRNRSVARPRQMAMAIGGWQVGAE